MCRCGPRPYSGLQVGIAFGVGLARAWSMPVVGMCSLDAIAWKIAGCPRPVRRWSNDGDTGHDGNSDDREFVVTADAKRREIYWARYGQEGNQVEGAQVTRRDDANFTVPTVDGMKPDPGRMAHYAALLLAAGNGPSQCPRGVVRTDRTARQWVCPQERSWPHDRCICGHPDITLSPRLSTGGSS